MIFVFTSATLIMLILEGHTVFSRANAEIVNIMVGNVRVEYDNMVFNITNVSMKYDAVWGPTMIGLIENTDPNRTIDGVYLSVQMYDKNNHLIGVMKGYPHSSYILPNQKTAFEIQSGDEDIRNIDHVYIEILATDWGSVPYSDPSESVLTLGNYSQDSPYIGIVGVALTPDLSKQIGLNQTKGFLITSITEGSPAENSDLKAGTIVKNYNDREINIGGDIIIKIDNTKVSYMHDITAYIQSQKEVGDKVTFTILRDNKIQQIDLILGEIPSNILDDISNTTLHNQDSNYPEELYDECVRVAGESFCEFLFRK
jgi:hypothetical protein